MSGLIWTATLTEQSSGGAVDSIDERSDFEIKKQRVKQDKCWFDDVCLEREERKEGAEMEYRKTRKDMARESLTATTRGLLFIFP